MFEQFEYQSIRELLIDAMTANESVKVQYPILLVIDFLVNEKKVVKMEDKLEVLEIYFLEKNRSKMNSLLEAYVQKRKDDQNWICFGYYK